MIHKIIIFLMICCLSNPVYAALDDQIISNKSETCKIHYLSQNTKKLWFIETDNDCPNGWVDGFAQVRLFDISGKQTEMLSGLFKQGYWLNYFIPLDKIIYRGNPQPNTQTLTMEIEYDSEIDTTYLALLRSIRPTDRSYPAFTLCQKEAHFLIAHNVYDDFKNPAFQARVFKYLRQQSTRLCPNTKRLIIWAVLNKESDGSDWILQADMDIASGQTNLRYRPLENISDPSAKPQELRQEKTDTLVAITPKDDGDITTTYGTSIRRKESTIPTTATSSAWDYTHKNYSLADFALLARIANQPVLGQAIIHIDSVALDGTAFVDIPFPVLISGASDLKSGWAKIKGAFSIENNQLVIQPLTVAACSKEWCDEK